MIAIIGLLIALLLPAVQSAREAARRTQCSNNMKQWVLASHSHHDSYNKLPTQQSASVTSSSGEWSATAALLPFMEAGNIYDSLKSFGAEPWGTAAHASSEPHFKNIATLLCPSDQNAKTPGICGAKGNLCVSYGDGSLQGNGAITSLSHAQCVMSRGMYVAKAARKFADITDGLSNTIAISESVTGNLNNLSNVLGGTSIQSSIQVGSSDAIQPINCLNNGISSTNRNTINAPYIHEDRWRCSRYLDGHYFHSGFHTILPPNSPNCKPVDGERVWGIYSASSFHSGGVNCGIGDGAVRFIPNSVDCGGLPQSVQGINLRGKSLFGVWGALGTPRGGDSATLP